VAFSRKQQPLIGLDISSTAVKLVELSKSGGGYKVESLAVEPLPANAVNEKEIQDVEAVGESVRRAVSKSKTKTKFAALAVSGSSVITKKIQMPANLSDDQLEEQIQVEADQYIPYPLEEVNLDFQVMALAEDSTDTCEVLLAACRSDNVDSRVAAAEIGGLTAKVVDVEAYTIETVLELISHELPEQGYGKTIAVVDVGATMSSLNVFHDRKLVYTREQSFGGRQLTEEIMRRYGLSYEEAGAAKKTEGDLPDNYIPEVLDPFKETMAQQVNRFLQFFFSSGHYSSVDHLLMAGGCAEIKGIADVVESHVHVPTSVADPFQGMGRAGKVNRNLLEHDGPSFLVACGLALRSFD
jgi:type IV pilus assembly protein PilM